MRRVILPVLLAVLAVNVGAQQRGSVVKRLPARQAPAEVASCGTTAVGQWHAGGQAQHSGEAIVWTIQTIGVDDGVADWDGAAALRLTQPGEYVISVTTPVNSDCGLYNWSTLLVNGTPVHSAKSLGGQRTLRNLYTFVKAGSGTEVLTVGFVTDNDAGGYTQGATITIEKVS